ncbi:probable LRR receptor-like serine/threonine-protein kinase At1g14390 [Zingiber officinale]|uniref:probable LRR receptor-like serine/threonine-protein kinase At1g14390 n=1 Tax=Zingiber officinale TaxID=94328 RepID=UPI001C4AA451|nr:probable LRR receptor-like serine/threonine-protein kinase At1g14390 [Zingiber officinale]
MRFLSPPMGASLLLLLLFVVSDAQQLSPSQSKTLLRLQGLLEYPPALAGWSRSTPFCYLPPSASLAVACSGNRIVELVIVGDRLASPGARNALSPAFSSDSLFTTLSRLPSLTRLSLVALGLWGPLPGKVDRFPSLKVLNLSSNYFSGSIPLEISTMTSLQNLVLSGNYLSGSVPDLKPLSSLLELNIGENRLGPEFPSLSNSLVILVLKNNSLLGQIPANLGAFHQLAMLDLSSNHLSGRIPPFLFSLRSMQHLDLSDNKITGQIAGNVPCSNVLEFVDLSNNHLVGGLPSCLRSNPSSRVVLTSGNCLNAGDLRNQHPNVYCDGAALAAVLPPANKISGSKSKVGVVLGIVGGVIGGAALLALLIFLVFRRTRTNESNAIVLHKPIAAKSLAQDTPRSPIDAGFKFQSARMESIGLTPYRVFSIEELKQATNNFDPSNLFEDSARGQFYKGQFQEGSLIEVRLLKLNPKLLYQNLHQYLELIAKLRHHHLASILGHCITSSQDSVNTTTIVHIVSEHVTNGTLRSHLTEWRKRELLKWPQRLAAVTGVARGIQFLHTVTVPGIIGNHLDTDSIKLDKTLTAKISRYDLPVLPKSKNKAGYERPFVPLDGRDDGSVDILDHGEEEDIYRLGLVLLEVITGKHSGSDRDADSLRSQLHGSLLDSPADLKGLADPTIRGTFAADSLRTAAEIALKCLSVDPSQRPSIDDVLWNLQYSGQIQDGWAMAENSSNQV